MTTSNPPEQGGRDVFEELIAGAWGAGHQELADVMVYTEAVNTAAIPQDELEALISGFLHDFALTFPSYDHAEYEKRLEAWQAEKQEGYFRPEKEDQTVLGHQLELLVQDFMVELDEADFDDNDRVVHIELQIQKKIGLAGDYQFFLGDDSFWLMRMLDELCPTDPQFANMSRDQVRTLNVINLGRTPDQRALYGQCIQEFCEEHEEDMVLQVPESCATGDEARDMRIKATLFAIASLNAVECFEDDFNSSGVPVEGLAMRRGKNELDRRGLQMMLAEIACGADLTITEMLEAIEPGITEVATQIYMALYQQIIESRHKTD
jgi:hypothetical protein